MPHPRRFRFAVELHEPLPGRTWLDSAREVEQLGYSTVFLPDHFDEGPGPSPRPPRSPRSPAR